MRKVTVSDRARYAFDNTISRGPLALVGWLFLLTAVMVLLGSLFVYLGGLAPSVNGHKSGFLQTLWLDILSTIDTGNVANDKGNWPYLLTMLLVTFGGIFVFTTFIGVVTQGIDGKLTELRKGRSFVVERDHTVVLGWSSQIFHILSELATANESRRGRGACVAVLASKDKVWMEDEIRTRVNSKNTRIVCRTGDPYDLLDLEIVNPNASRSIIVLPSDPEDPDSQVIKTVLALTNNPNRRKEPYHIVSRVRKPENLGVAKMVGKEEAELVLVDDLIARITAQTCRQSGLSVVYLDLLDFEGDEIYFKEEPSLAGKSFRDALFAYEKCAAIGLKKDGKILLNPPPEERVEKGDALVVIAEDDSTIGAPDAEGSEVVESAVREGHRPARPPERTLILGWNRRAPVVVEELDGYVSEGSEVVVVIGEPATSGSAAEELASLADRLENQTLSFHFGNTSDRATLDSLAVHEYDHIVVLSYSEVLEPKDADSRTLMTLLHLREISDAKAAPFSIVTEMLDGKNRELAEVTRADDFIVSDRLVSLMMSQVSENKDLFAVFEQLFSPEGSEIYLKPAADYVEPGQKVNFSTLVAAAARRKEVALGYRARPQGVVLNPAKSSPVTLESTDRIIVLADS